MALKGYEKGNGFESSSACDNNPMCQKILMEHVHKCVHTEIEGRLPKASQEKLREVHTGGGKPQASASDEEKEAHCSRMEATYAALTAICKEEMNFQDDAECLCVAHRRKCKVYGNTRNGSVVVDVSGVRCTDWSRRGLRCGIGGPSAKAFTVWLYELKMRKEVDCFVEECTEDFDEQLLQAVLADDFDIEFVVIGPDNLGWGCLRPRKIVTGVRRSRWVRTTDMGTFCRLMVVRPQLTGESYYAAPADMVKTDLEARYKKRNKPVPAYPELPSYADVFTESAYGTLLVSDRMFQQQMQAKSVPRSKWQWPIVDVEAICTHGKIQENSMLRTLVTHGTHFSTNPAIWRPLLGTETLMVQGIPMSSA